MAFDWFRRRYEQQTEAAKTEAEPPEAEPSAVESAATAEEETTAEDYLNWAKAAYQNIQKRQQQDVEKAQAGAGTAETEADEVAVAPAAVPPTPATELPTVSEAESAIPSPAAIAEAIPEPVAATPEVLPEPLAAAAEPEPPPPTPAELETEVESTGVVTESTTRQEEIEVESVAAVSREEPVAPEATPIVAGEPVVATVEPPPAETPPAEPATPLPFWAQAAAESQQRLERLRESAIAEPETSVVSPTAPISTATTVAPTEETEATPADLLFDEGFLWSAEILAAQGRRPDDISLEEITWLKRLRQGLDKTRRGLVNQLRAIVGQGPLNQDAVLEIETALLQADVGVEATDAIITALQQKVKDEVLPPEAAINYLKEILREMLDSPLQNSQGKTFAPEKERLNIWLMTGVNGAGKTTTIGKLAHIAQKSGYECLIAAADTFRAAAVEQVKVWGQRSNVDVIANPGQNTDPAAVVFDAISSAQARGTELLLIDTAGRLQNKKNLMDELSKVRRIIDKKAPDAVVESLLVLDATLGQNGLRQAQVFSEAAKLSGVVLTKLDGTAKGGIALAIVQQLGLPIRFIGAGEGIEDLRPFSSFEFVEALLNG
jgi:fused signal recognition particle receptor